MSKFWFKNEEEKKCIVPFEHIDVIKRMRQLQLQLEEAHSRWNEFKKWLQDKSIELGRKCCGEKYFNEIFMISIIINKMQSLERGERDE